MDTNNLAHLWTDLPEKTRQKICRQYGFGDWRVYAQYHWQDFQPHTREALANQVLLEIDAASGFDRK